MMYLIPTQALNAQWLAPPSPLLSPAVGWSTYTERNNGLSPPIPAEVRDVFAIVFHLSQPAPYCYKGCLRCGPEWKRAGCRPPTHQMVPSEDENQQALLGLGEAVSLQCPGLPKYENKEFEKCHF